MGTTDAVNPSDQYILLFDGVCNLCNGAVQFIIKRDSDKAFRFAALQSPFGQEKLRQVGLSTTQLDTFILLKENKFYVRSDAALEVVRKLDGLWPALYAFRILPRFFRDLVYHLLAKSRYRLFGKGDHCMVPSPELRSRFLHD